MREHHKSNSARSKQRLSGSTFHTVHTHINKRIVSEQQGTRWDVQEFAQSSRGNGCRSTGGPGQGAVDHTRINGCPKAATRLGGGCRRAANVGRMNTTHGCSGGRGRGDRPPPLQKMMIAVARCIRRGCDRPNENECSDHQQRRRAAEQQQNSVGRGVERPDYASTQRV